MKSMRHAFAAIVLAAALASAAPARAAGASDYSCGMHGAPLSETGGNLLNCSYEHAPGLHRIDDGGPWMHVDLLHDTLDTLRELYLGTSGQTMYEGGPLVPPLGLVHSYICLSDPKVPPGKCPGNYPTTRPTRAWATL